MDGLKSGIYEILNTINGNRYIGSAVNFQNRWWVHTCDLRKGKHACGHLQHAWRKYGPDAFKFTRLLICDKRNLLMYEQRAIDALQPEYNICKVAGSQLGTKRSAETREKNRLAALGRKHSDEHRRKNSIGHKGVVFTDEWRAKISAAKLGKKHSPERCARNAAGQTGRKLSAATRAKMSASQRARFAGH